MNVNKLLTNLIGTNIRKFYVRITILNRVSILLLGFYIGKLIFGTMLKQYLMLNILLIICLLAILALSNNLMLSSIETMIKENQNNSDKKSLEE